MTTTYTSVPKGTNEKKSLPTVKEVLREAMPLFITSFIPLHTVDINEISSPSDVDTVSKSVVLSVVLGPHVVELERAKEAALVIEKSFEEYCKQYRYTPPPYKSLILNTLWEENVEPMPYNISWAEALYDGKNHTIWVVFPLADKGKDTLSERVVSALKHETFHAYAKLSSKGKLPLWLNEGLAEISAASEVKKFFPPELAARMSAIELEKLEKTISSTDMKDITSAYASSLIAARWLLEHKGQGAIAQYFELLRNYKTDAFFTAFQVKLQELNREVKKWFEYYREKVLSKNVGRLSEKEK